MKSLATGSYSLVADFVDGQSNFNIEVTNNETETNPEDDTTSEENSESETPQTGDASNVIYLWIIIGLCFVGLVIIIVIKVKK